MACRRSVFLASGFGMTPITRKLIAVDLWRPHVRDRRVADVVSAVIRLQG